MKVGTDRDDWVIRFHSQFAPADYVDLQASAWENKAPVAEPIMSSNGDWTVPLGGRRSASVCRWVAGRDLSVVPLTRELSANVGTMLAQLHTATAHKEHWPEGRIAVPAALQRRKVLAAAAKKVIAQDVGQQRGSCGPK